MARNYNNKTNFNRFEFLRDYSDTGKEIDWKGKKKDSEKLSGSYGRLSVHFKGTDLEKKYFNKMLKVDSCANYLEFRRLHDDRLKLHRAFFCKDRLCPLCMWRRSRKVGGMVKAVVDRIKEQGNRTFIFLTLTVRNCWGPDLEKEVTHLLNAYRRFREVRRIKSTFLGFFRALEITRSTWERNKDGTPNLWMGSYHPHLHCIGVVETDRYFNDPGCYLGQRELSILWKQCLRADDVPIVDIREIRSTDEKGIAKVVSEVAKYTLKSKDIIPPGIPQDISKADLKTYEKIEEMDENVFVLSDSLFNRRLVSFSGIFGKLKQEIFGDDDAIDGDLVHTEEETAPEEQIEIIRYFWNRRLRDYCLLDKNC